MKITNGSAPLLAALTLATALAATGCHAPPPPAPPPAPAAAPPPRPTLIGVTMTGGQLDIAGDVEFDTGAATLRDTPGTRGVLGAVLKILQDNPVISRVRIEGHTDSDGTEAGNQALSEKRAGAVVKWLADKGVDSKRLSAVGCGQRDPLVPNTSPENKQRNRRTELDVELFDGKAPEGFTSACAPNASRKR